MNVTLYSTGKEQRVRIEYSLMNAIITEGFESPAFRVVRAINKAVSYGQNGPRGHDNLPEFAVINEV